MSLIIRPRRGRGMALVYLTVTMLVFVGFTSLAVDFGRVQVAKSQLRVIADAAARSGAMYVSSSTTNAVAQAIAVAASNNVDGATYSLSSSDVVVGTWSSGSFSAGGGSPNAVQVSVYRTGARGNAIPLVFGQIVGVPSCDIKATSTAYSVAGKPAFVGLNGINITGAFLTDSYVGTSTYTAGSASSNSSLATNNAGNLNGTITIKGKLSRGSGQSFTVNGTLNVSGSNTTLSTPMSYAAATAGSAATTNNNAIIPSNYLSGGNFNMSSGSLFMPGGTYYFNNISMGGGSITMLGAVVIYVNGNTTFSGGSIVTSGNDPANFQIYNVSGAGVNITGGSSVYAQIYSPQGPLNYNNNNVDFYGSIVASQISISANTGWHYDTLLGTSSISVVK